MRRGEIRARLDAGEGNRPLRLVVSSDLWNEASPYTHTCHVVQARPSASHATMVPLPDTDWCVIPGMVTWTPMSALGPVQATVPPGTVDEVLRILRGVFS